mgnify:CR=1 FL=1
MSTIKTTNITHGSNSGTANLALASDGTITFAKSLDNTPVWIVKPSGDQGSVAQDTATKVAWGTEVLDTDSAFASDKFTVPAGKAGAYAIQVQVCVDDIEDQKEITIWVYKNGSQELRSYGYASTDNQINMIREHSSVHVLAAADYLEIYIVHGTSGNQTILANRTRWSGYRLAGYNP